MRGARTGIRTSGDRVRSVGSILRHKVCKIVAPNRESGVDADGLSNIADHQRDRNKSQELRIRYTLAPWINANIS